MARERYRANAQWSVAAHSLLFCFTCTSSLVLALRSIESVADGDIQTMAAASGGLLTVEESTVLSNILYAALEYVADAGSQAECIVLQPILLHYEAEIARGGEHTEVQYVALCHDAGIGFQLPTMLQAEGVIEVEKEDGFGESHLRLTCGYARVIEGHCVPKLLSADGP